MSPIVRTYVELNENQDEKSFWELTPYGEILYKVRVEHNCSTNWIYNYVVTPEEFDKETGNLGPEEIRERK